MKILIYSANFAPEKVGIGKYSGEMADWLASQGHTVRVVCAPPYYPDWKVDSGYRKASYQREVWNEIRIWRCPLWVPAKPSGLKRIVHLLTFAASSFPVMLRHVFWRPDVVLTVAPAFVCAPAGWLTARLAGAQAWLHLQDFEVDIAFQMNMLKSPLLQRWALTAERWMLGRFNSVSSISRRMVERLETKGVRQDRIQFFPNWVDVNHIKPSCDGGAYRRELGIAEDAIVVLYAGALAAKQGLHIIPPVATMLAKRKDIAFVICGDGVLKHKLASDSEGMTNVHLLPLQPFERLGELLCMADIHLLPQNPSAADLVLPSKLSGMLASGRPVVSTCRPGTDLESVIALCGLVVPPGDQEGLANAICTLADDPVLRLQLGAESRQWAELHVDREVVLQRMFGDLTVAPTDRRVPIPVDEPLALSEADATDAPAQRPAVRV